MSLSGLSLFHSLPLRVHTDKAADRGGRSALEGPERQLSVAVDARSARKCRAYFLEGSATTNSLSAGRMRVRGRSCQYFSGRSTVQLAFTIEFRVAHSRSGCTTIRRVAVGLRSRVVGRASPRATPSNRKCLSPVHILPVLCLVPLSCRPKLCASVCTHLVGGGKREGVQHRGSVR